MRIFLICLAIAVAAFLIHVERRRGDVIAYVSNENPVMFDGETAAIKAQYGDTLPAGHVVFLGDSLIRLWHTVDQDMAPIPVLNHGFGGSKVRDSTFYIDRLVTPFEPEALVLSFGTNDMHGLTGNSKSGADVADLIIEFFETAHAAAPDLPIIYISVTPTPSRWKVWNEAQKTNALLKARAKTDPRITFLDLRSEFLQGDYVNRDLYDPDGLHLNAAGYAVWTKHVKPALEQALSR